MGQQFWIKEILGPYIGDWIIDTRHELIQDHVILFDRFVNARDSSYYSQFRGRDAFLVDLADENYDFNPQIYANFRGVLRCYWSGVFRKQAVRFLPLGFPGELSLPDELRKSSERQYAWSFLGQMDKSSRPEMATVLASVEPHLLFAVDQPQQLIMWNRTSHGPRRYSVEDSNRILQDSIFAPSPMGNVNLECWRVYEALQVGSIPIIEKRLSLDYFRGLWGAHPIPTVSSWSEARHLIASHLNDSDKLDRLQKKCTDWWQAYKEDLTRSFGEFLYSRSRTSELLEPKDIVAAYYFLPGWQTVELLRHHNRSALGRRINRQLRRAIIERKFRVASGSKKL